MNDVVVGAWRNGLDDSTRSLVEEAAKRRDQGFRQFTYEQAVVNLSDMLDGYDTVAEELITTQPTIDDVVAGLL